VQIIEAGRLITAVYSKAIAIEVSSSDSGFFPERAGRTHRTDDEDGLLPRLYIVKTWYPSRMKGSIPA
jgi:hypothetical protein